MADPAWLAQLKMASFRGVPFQVDSVDWTSGDNLVVREYPFQDLPTVFRMGAATDELHFSAYVIGDDYIDQREALRKVLVELTEPGVLIHPTAGSMRAYVANKFRMVENPRDEGGMCRFDLAFVRADGRRYPVAEANTSARAKVAAAAAKDAAADDFASRFSIKNAPAWVSERVLGRVNASLDTSWVSIKQASGGLGDYTSGIIGTYQVLRGGTNSLVSTPRDLASQTRQLFTLPSDLKPAAAAGFRDAFAGIFNMGSKLPKTDHVQVVNQNTYGLANLPQTTSTPARAQLDSLNASVDRLFGTLATAAWVEAVVDTDLAGYDQALALRKALHTQCMSLIESASTETGTGTAASDWHAAMVELLSRGLADLQARSADLARLTTYTPTAWTPVWCVSYDLYGTTEWADEIMANNPHITHPLLVPPGKPLRVVLH